MDDGSGLLFCFTPMRVPVSELATRRRLSAIAFPVIGIRLFRPASPPRPLSGLPAVRAGVRGVSLSRLLESHARPGLSARGPAQSRERTAPFATPASRAATLRAPDRDFRGNGSSGLGCAPRRLTATTAAWPSNAVGPVRNAAIIPTSPPLSKTRSCRPTSATARGVVSRSPISQAPRIPQSWRSMSGPIAESFAVAVIDRLARVVLIPASSPPRHRTG